MGGGPSREERDYQSRLREREASAVETQNRLMERAEKPDELAERIRGTRMKWLDAVEGKAGPFDVTKLEPMAPYLNLWNRSRTRRDGARMGTGALRLGVANQNPEIAARISSQQEIEREQEAGGALQGAFNLKNAEMTESLMPLMSLQQSRDLSLAGMGSNNVASATDAYAQWLSRPKPRSFWSELALGGVGAAGNMIKFAPLSI